MAQATNIVPFPKQKKKPQCYTLHEAPVYLPGCDALLKAAKDDYESLFVSIRVAAMFCASPLSKITKLHKIGHDDLGSRCISDLEDLVGALAEISDIAENGLERARAALTGVA